MTGFVTLGSTFPSGSWIEGTVNRVWNKIAWNGSTPYGTGIRVEVRASNTLTQLPSLSFTTVLAVKAIDATLTLVACLASVVFSPVNAQQAPTITVEPLSQDVSAGSEVSFSVTAVGGEPLSYQWRKEGIELVDGGKASGVTSAVLTPSEVQGTEMGRYSVRVGNELGSVISAEASLHLVPLAAWGYNDYGQATVPAGLSNIVAIAAGPSHNLVVHADGTVAAWGGNIDGYGYTNVPPGMSNVVAVAAGYRHSLALLDDGNVVAWGHPDVTDVPSHVTNAIAVAAGIGHSVALHTDGTVVAWGGENYSGQTDVPSGLSHVVQIAGGGGFSMALRMDGTLVMWGARNDSRVVNPPTGLRHVVAIAAGGMHSLALVDLEYYPQLSICREAGNVAVSWTGGRGPFQLLRSADLLVPGAWENVGEPVTTNAVLLPLGPDTRFLRVLDLAPRR